MQPGPEVASEALLGSAPVSPRLRRGAGLLVMAVLGAYFCSSMSRSSSVGAAFLKPAPLAHALARARGLAGSPPGRAGSAVRMVDLPTEDAKALHALGFNVGNQLGEINAGWDEAQIDYILSGVKASFLSQDPAVPLQEYVPKAAAMIQDKRFQAAEAAAAAGTAALEAAAQESGATKTASGLVIKTLVEGTGDAPKASDTVEVHYEGTLVDGTVFDSSYKRGEPISFPLAGVIPGWTEGLQLMKVGGKAQLTIPYDIAYGEMGNPPVIPPKATLIFQVELLAIK